MIVSKYLKTIITGHFERVSEIKYIYKVIYKLTYLLNE